MPLPSLPPSQASLVPSLLLNKTLSHSDNKCMARLQSTSSLPPRSILLIKLPSGYAASLHLSSPLCLPFRLLHSLYIIKFSLSLSLHLSCLSFISLSHLLLQNKIDQTNKAWIELRYWRKKSKSDEEKESKHTYVLPSSHPPILPSSHPPILPSSHPPILPSSHPPILPSCSPSPFSPLLLLTFISDTTSTLRSCSECSTTALMHRWPNGSSTLLTSKWSSTPTQPAWPHACNGYFH